MAYDLVFSYATVALVRAANAIFIVSLVFTLPHLSSTVHGLILASYALAEGLTGFLIGGFYERFGGRITLMFATLILSASYLTMTFIPHPTLLIILNFINGVMAAGVLVASLSDLAEGTRGRPMTRLFGSGGFEASNLGGYAVGFSIALALELLGALGGFLVPAMLSGLAMVSSLLTPSGGGRSFTLSLESRALRLAPLWFGLASLVGLAFMAPKILKETGITIVSLDEGGGGLSLTLIGGLLVVAVGLLIGSYIASVIGKIRAVILGTVSITVALVIGGLYYDIILKPTLIPLLVALAIPAMTLPPAMLALLADYTDTSRSRGPQMGFYVTVLALGIAFGEFVVGGVIFERLGLTVTAIAAAVMFAVLSMPTVYMLLRSSNNHSSS